MVKVEFDRDYVKSRKIVYFFAKLIIDTHEISTSSEISRVLSIDMKQYNERLVKLAKQIGADTFAIDEDPSRPEYEDYLTFVIKETSVKKIDQMKQKFEEEFLIELTTATLNQEVIQWI